MRFMTEMTVYLFILKSISGPNFNNLYKLWILWSCIGLGLFVKEKKYRLKKGIRVNWTLNADSKSACCYSWVYLKAR